MKGNQCCKARSKSGQICRMPPGADGYCFIHSPARARERAESRRKGGQARHTPHSGATMPPTTVNSLGDCRAILAYALAEALEGDNSIARGRLLVAIAQAGLEAWKIGELEQRLAMLEAAFKVGHSEPHQPA